MRNLKLNSPSPASAAPAPRTTSRVPSSPELGCGVSPGLCIGHESLQSDLDEAWEIAERGPMPLFMADIHLYRARLFGGQKDEGRRMKGSAAYPYWTVEEDLKEARRLIEEHGYGRRKEELEDAEAALLGNKG